MTPIPVVLVGAGTRMAGHYVPLLQGLFSERVRPIGLVSASEHRGPKLADRLGVPWSQSLEDAPSWGARGAIAAVSPHENHRVGSQLAALGLPALLETPLAMQLTEAAGLLATLQASGLPYEIAEQNPRHLGPRLWRRVLQEGLLGKLRAVDCGGAGYRYHGTATARALFDKPRSGWAQGTRALTGVDLGRGVMNEPLTSGTISLSDGRIYTARYSELYFHPSSCWEPGGWVLSGQDGWLDSSRGVRTCRNPSGQASQNETFHFEWSAEDEQLSAVPSDGGASLTVQSSSPGRGLDDDGQAIAQCIEDWLTLMGGGQSRTSWSPEDAFEDLLWIHAIEQSSLLRGATIDLGSLAEAVRGKAGQELP